MIVIVFFIIALLAAAMIWYDHEKSRIFKNPTQKKMAWGVVITALIGVLLALLKKRGRS